MFLNLIQISKEHTVRKTVENLITRCVCIVCLCPTKIRLMFHNPLFGLLLFVVMLYVPATILVMSGRFPVFLGLTSRLLGTG